MNNWIFNISFTSTFPPSVAVQIAPPTPSQISWL